MTEPRQIAVVRSYDELLAALRARVAELGATRESIDEVAGFATRHSAKLLAPTAPRAFGRVTLGPMLGALGLVIIVQEDLQALERVKNRLGKGQAFRMLNGAKNKPVILKFSRRYMKKIAVSGGKTRAERLSAYRRQAIARKAGKARQAKRREKEVMLNAGKLNEQKTP